LNECSFQKIGLSFVIHVRSKLLQSCVSSQRKKNGFKMSIRPTESSVALEWRSKAYKLYQEGRFSQAQDYAGKALTTDSQFFEAYTVWPGAMLLKVTMTKQRKRSGKRCSSTLIIRWGITFWAQFSCFRGKK